MDDDTNVLGQKIMTCPTISVNRSGLRSRVKHWAQLHLRILGLALGVVLFASIATGGESKNVRLAVVPFFAPAGNDQLQKVSLVLPELLTAELSHQSSFEVVERDKVGAILNELQLAADGLSSSDVVMKLGQMLACDRLASGSLVMTESGIQIWAKIIDTRTGVVLDIQSVPYVGTNLSVTVKGIATFLSQAVARPRPRQFIALGRFTDISISTAREDWSRRLRAIIERHFLATGFGVVEREAIRPVIEEYQLEGAGLTGSYSNRVKLQPAFWIVDGGCKWVRDTQDKVSVALRVQKVGGREQVFQLTELPGTNLEHAVLATIRSSLIGPNQVVAGQASLEEARYPVGAGDGTGRGASPGAPNATRRPRTCRKRRSDEKTIGRQLKGLKKRYCLIPTISTPSVCSPMGYSATKTCYSDNAPRICCRKLLRRATKALPLGRKNGWARPSQRRFVSRHRSR